MKEYSVREKIENTISNHSLSNYLVHHEFISDEDDNERLVIRPIQIMINYFNSSDFGHYYRDKKDFIKKYREEILEILTAIEIPEEELEKAFKDFTGLLFEEELIYMINMLDRLIKIEGGINE